MKIDVLCTRELDSEGSGGSQNRCNLRCFLEGAKSGPLGGTFCVFVDFWGPKGWQLGSLWAEKGIFFEVCFFDAFWVK